MSVDSLPHRKWKQIKQQPSMLPGPAVPGCCLIAFHFRWGKLSTRTVVECSICSIQLSLFHNSCCI